MNLIILSALIGAAFCQLEYIDNPVTGTTPPAVSCPNSLCDGRYDGNYEYNGNSHYFLQCVGGIASCQACWPLTLEYSGQCNQCLYNRYDACVTTEKWQPATTFSCPDICPSKGYEFDGNIADPSNKRHYVACWKGMNVGCVACPAGLEFNEQLNACLYEGRYVTEPVHDSNNGVYNPPTARPTARPRPRPTRRTTPRRGGPIYLNPFDYRL